MAFNAEQRAALSNLGTGIAATLQDRWHRQEYEDFLQGEYAEYRRSLIELNEQMLNNPDKPDIVSNTLQSFFKEQMSMMDKAARYPKNPYIGALSQGAMANDMQHSDNIIQQFEAAGARGRAPEEREAAAEAQAAKTDLDKARAEQQRAEAGYLKRKKDSGAGLTKAAADRMLYTQGAGPTVREKRAALALHRGDPDFQAELTEIYNHTAQELLRQGFDPGPMANTPEKQLQAALQAVDPIKARHQLEAKILLREGVDPYQLMQDPELAPHVPGFDNLQEASRGHRLISRDEEYKDAFVVVEFLGEDGATSLGQANIDSVKEIVESLPDSVAELGGGEGGYGPMQAAIVAASSGNNPITGKRFQSYKEMEKFIDDTMDKTLSASQIDFSDPDQMRVYQRLKKATHVKYTRALADLFGLKGTPKRRPEQGVIDTNSLLGLATGAFTRGAEALAPALGGIFGADDSEL